jgi:phosphate acetyltransferase
MEMVVAGRADAVVAGIDYTSRDVILTARDILGMREGLRAFSSVFLMDLPDGRMYALADCATCKHPTVEQLADIIVCTAESAEKTMGEVRVAVLSFSTLGGGGHDETIDIARAAISLARERIPELTIDGEMQLDAAVNERVAQKKAPESAVAGRANVLICPDINAGNILYKSMQQFAGAKAYGPILQGFYYPVSDLSRGSTEDDVYGVVKMMTKLA